MSFDATQHPRATDGKFAEKKGTPAEFTLGAFATAADAKNFRELDYIWRRDMADRAGDDVSRQREVTAEVVKRGVALNEKGVFAENFDQMDAFIFWDELNENRPDHVRQTEEIVQNPNEYTDEEVFDTLAAANAARNHDARAVLISVLQDRGVAIPTYNPESPVWNPDSDILDDDPDD